MTEAELRAALEQTRAELAAALTELQALRKRESLVLDAQAEMEKIAEMSRRLDEKVAFYDRKLSAMEASLGDTEKKMTFIEGKSFLGVNWLFFSFNVVLALVFIAATAHACRG